MSKIIKMLLLAIVIFIILSLFGCIVLTKNIRKNYDTSSWMEKWKVVYRIDLKADRIINNLFIVNFDSDWDLPPEWDEDKEHLIVIDLDILFNEVLNNYILIEISTINEIIYSNKFNIFEPVANHLNSKTQSIITENGINYKLHGIYGEVKLEYDIEYHIKIETYFDDNLIEINKLLLRIEKRVL
jgi:hypothetical protein